MLGLEAAGRNPLDISKGGRTPVDYLRSTIGDIESSGDYARTILALEGAGVDAHSFGGRDLVSLLVKRRGSNGSWEGWPGTTAFAVLALRAAGDTGDLEKSLSWLGDVQNSDGGWGDEREQAEHPRQHRRRDAGDAELEALPARPLVPQIGAALERRLRPRTGSGPANSQSTAWAAQGMIADRHRSGLDHEEGHSARGLPARAPGLRRPLQLLLLEQPDPGLGHGPGPAGDRRQRVPDLAGPPRRTEAEAGAERTRRKLAGAADPVDPRTTLTPPSSSGGSGSGIGLGGRRVGAADPAGGDPRAADPGLADHGRGRRAGNSAAVEFEATEPPQRRRIRWPRSGSASAPAPSPSAACCSSVGASAGEASSEPRGWMSRRRSAPAAPTRRSAPEPLDREELEALLELARWAPNHHLTAPWRFRVLGPQSLAALKEAAGPEGAAKLDRAPTLVVVSAVLAGRSGPGRGGPPRDRRRLLHRPARRPRPRPRRLLADADGAARARRGGAPSASAATSASSASSISGAPRQEKAPPERPPVDQVTEFLP